jgi:hypothetical protein
MLLLLLLLLPLLHFQGAECFPVFMKSGVDINQPAFLVLAAAAAATSALSGC